MARLDLWHKLQRMLRFLCALNDPRIFTLMMLRGFTNATRKKGWDLFLKAGGQLVDMEPPPPSSGQPAELLKLVDDYENEWYDVIEAALEGNYPTVCKEVFKNLHKSSDERVVLTVETLLNRVDVIEKQGEPLKPVLDLLTERGFTKPVRQKGRELIGSLRDGHVPLLATPDPAAEAERARAEDEMWSFYREWAKTARTIVRRKDLRIKMGISTATREVADEDEEPAPPPAPGAAAPPAGPGTPR
ncbi:MAG: hypothetical protein HY906_11660 [Deltaproteobacteria bacterium]|nr:hypothetical protein [Deltaproteobacteria bacterium]